MLNFLIPKNKIRLFDIFENNIENFQIFGVSQINPYCEIEYKNKIFLTVVNIANESKDYDEKEGIIATKYFTVRKCPKCRQMHIVPVEIKINAYEEYLSHQEDYAYDNYKTSRYNFPTQVRAYCSNCNSCFTIYIKNEDLWIKEAKKIKEKQLIDNSWQEYRVD